MWMYNLCTQCWLIYSLKIDFIVSSRGFIQLKNVLNRFSAIKTKNQMRDNTDYILDNLWCQTGKLEHTSFHDAITIELSVKDQGNP
jgi:hypothetical protein